MDRVLRLTKSSQTPLLSIEGSAPTEKMFRLYPTHKPSFFSHVHVRGCVDNLYISREQKGKLSLLGELEVKHGEQ